MSRHKSQRLADHHRKNYRYSYEPYSTIADAHFPGHPKPPPPVHFFMDGKLDPHSLQNLVFRSTLLHRQQPRPACPSGENTLQLESLRQLRVIFQNVESSNFVPVTTGQKVKPRHYNRTLPGMGVIAGKSTSAAHPPPKWPRQISVHRQA